MAGTVDKYEAAHNLVLEEQTQDTTPSQCSIRSDDSGIWNTCKAWYLFLVHLVASILFTIGIRRIDRQDFQIGLGSTLFAPSSTLYQVQVTALISLALVIIRLIAGSCSALLAWRIIFVLLENRGISLVELTRLTAWRVPILPGRRSKVPLLWSLWATVTILLLWPSGFAAPLASSSVSWIPGVRVSRDSMPARVQSLGEYADWASILYQDMRASTVVAAAVMAGKDPSYAFHSSQIPLRRYFNSSQAVPDGSEIDITVPYFAVGLRWVDASSDNRSQDVGDSHFQDVDSDFSIRIVGATGIVRDQPWDGQAAMPSQAEIFAGNKLVGVKLRTINFGDELPGGSRANASTKCSTVVGDFGNVPTVEQHQSPIGNGQETVAYDCYILAEASITAGKYTARNCTVAAFTGNSDLYATCSTRRDDAAVVEDWLSDLALDFTSEVLKHSVLQNFSQPWISNDLNDYTTGMLTLGYHAAWSGLMKKLGNASEPVTFRSSQAIVSASIDSTKLYIWLVMNATLTISAIFVFVAQSISKTRTIRDAALAALTVDLTQVSHSSCANGLCNAVTLSKEDHKLPRLKWQDYLKESETGEAGACRLCPRKVSFVDSFTEY